MGQGGVLGALPHPRTERGGELNSRAPAGRSSTADSATHVRHSPTLFSNVAGDSGGPLFYAGDTGSDTVVGITSFGLVVSETTCISRCVPASGGGRGGMPGVWSSVVARCTAPAGLAACRPFCVCKVQSSDAHGACIQQPRP